MKVALQVVDPGIFFWGGGGGEGGGGGGGRRRINTPAVHAGATTWYLAVGLFMHIIFYLSSKLFFTLDEVILLEEKKLEPK